MQRVVGVISLAFLLVAPAARSAVEDPAAAFVSQMAKDANVTELSGLVVTATKPKPTELSGVDVVAKPRAVPLDGVEVADPIRCLQPRTPTDNTVPAPKLVSTYPAKGQVVKPGYAVLRLTFDLPMACRGDVGASLAPACAVQKDDPGVAEREPEFADKVKPRKVEIWHQSYDRRTLLILCKLQPDTRYALAINIDKHWQHFQGLSGQEPGAGFLIFETSHRPVETSIAAMVERDPELAALIKR
jgi:hypothetical protein